MPVPSYLLAAAVIVIIAIGAVGILLIRRRRRAEQDDLPGSVAAASVLAPTAAAPMAARSDVATVLIPAADDEAPELAPAGAPTVAEQQAPGVGQDHLHGVEQLLVEWRASHELSVMRGNQADDLPAQDRFEKGAASSPYASPGSEAASAAPAVAVAPGWTASGERQSVVPPPRIPAVSSEFEAAGYEIGAAELAAHAVLLDPLGVVVLDMVDGTGRLGPAELKRLEVFRPDRIEWATRTLELPPRLRDDEDALLRLAQIQLYAATLALRSKWAARLPAGGGAQEAPYSAKDFKLKIARDIMELPAADRSEIIGYLLGGLLIGEGSTTELKRAVIDTLENLRSAALINVLLDCLDDPDPIVQEYALAAADRVLDR